MRLIFCLSAVSHRRLFRYVVEMQYFCTGFQKTTEVRCNFYLLTRESFCIACVHVKGLS